MRQKLPRRWLPAVILIALTAILLLAASGSPLLAPRGAMPDGPQWIAAALLCLAAGAYRPLAGSSLGLGVLVLPPAFVLLGAVPTALAAVLASLGIEILHRRLARPQGDLFPERRRPLRNLETAAANALAVLAAGSAWAIAAPESPRTLADSALYDATAASAGAYVLVLIAARATAERAHRPQDRPEGLSVLLPLGVDLAAWWMGAALAVVATSAGALPSAALAGALGALSLEAFRLSRRLSTSQQRVGELEEVSRAGHRMIAGSSQLAAMAEQILIECRKLLPFRWFQLELLTLGQGPTSWAAGPDGTLYDGVPRPEKNPPALPGFHRRSPWKLLEYSLDAEGRSLAALRLWCDPRAMTGSDVALVEALLPQLASSVQRALLDREAKLDPLTGVSMRRVLERELEQAYKTALENGGSMALVMCDLDHFKRINDTFGHAAGDQALIAVARVLASHIKPADVCCRYGGEEFLLLLTQADGSTGLAVAERLRQEVERVDLTVDGQRIPLAMSAGVAAFPDVYAASPQELVEIADGALYQAKRRGRNMCLLDMGRGRFRAPTGTMYASPEAREAVAPPRIFV